MVKVNERKEMNNERRSKKVVDEEKENKLYEKKERVLQVILGWHEEALFLFGFSFTCIT